jgi:hypothetical protein
MLDTNAHKPAADRAVKLTCAREMIAEAHGLLSAALGFPPANGAGADLNPRDAHAVAHAFARARAGIDAAAKLLSEAFDPPALAGAELPKAAGGVS